MDLSALNLKNKWLLGIAVVVLSLFLGILFYLFGSNLPPIEAVGLSVQRTLGAESYRYHALSKKILNGEEKILSEVHGEKNQDNVHFIGQLFLVNSMFEYYQIDDKIYRKDPFSNQWLIVEDMQRQVTEQLIQEINPLGTLCFQEIIAAEYLGKEKVDGKKYRKYQFEAQTDNKYLTGLWHDFTFLIWTTNQKEGMIKRVEIEASSKKEPLQILIMEIEFNDYNKDLLITPPL